MVLARPPRANHIIATGGGGYASRLNVVRAVKRFQSLMGLGKMMVDLA